MVDATDKVIFKIKTSIRYMLRLQCQNYDLFKQGVNGQKLSWSRELIHTENSELISFSFLIVGRGGKIIKGGGGQNNKE